MLLSVCLCLHITVQVIDKEMVKFVNRFQRKQNKGTIDVWWLFDDGGTTCHGIYHEKATCALYTLTSSRPTLSPYCSDSAVR